MERGILLISRRWWFHFLFLNHSPCLTLPPTPPCPSIQSPFTNPNSQPFDAFLVLHHPQMQDETMSSVDIRQFISPWPFTVPETQWPSSCAADEQQHYLTSYNLNEFTDDEASLWWYAFCGGEEEVGNTLYNRCSRITNKSYKETREELSRQSYIERNTEIVISQVGTTTILRFFYILALATTTTTVCAFKPLYAFWKKFQCCCSS